MNGTGGLTVPACSVWRSLRWGHKKNWPPKGQVVNLGIQGCLDWILAKHASATLGRPGGRDSVAVTKKLMHVMRAYQLYAATY